jgi:hypothetical protein
MITILSHALFNNKEPKQGVLLGCAWSYILLIFLHLFIDSPNFAKQYFDGRYLIDITVIIHFSIIFRAAEARLIKLMFVMIFLSYLGELIFCNGLHLYDYRTPYIPFYVPFGHAILYATGYIFAHTDWAKRHDALLSWRNLG